MSLAKRARDAGCGPRFEWWMRAWLASGRPGPRALLKPAPGPPPRPGPITRETTAAGRVGRDDASQTYLF